MLPAAFGPLLRQWRLSRQLSQERLAEEAEVSARHISFIETGRAAPSREMVLVLASALELPLRERNTLLGAAGFAPVYRETALAGAAMTPVKRALDYILKKQEPYGAIIVDRLWNVLEMNQGAARMLGFWVDLSSAPVEVRSNALHAIFHPDGLRRHVVDWEELATTLAQRLHREILEPGGEQTEALLASLLRYPGVPQRLRQPDLSRPLDAILPVHLKRDDLEVRLFTMVTTLGTPLDVTAQELRVESYFPADDATEDWIKQLAESIA